MPFGAGGEFVGGGGGPGGGGGGGSIDEITSDDDSVTITNPTGPTTDLSVPGAANNTLPVADTTDFSIDDSTYPNNLTGTGFYRTVIFPGGDQTGVLALALDGDAFPRILLASTGTFLLSDGTVDPSTFAAAINANANGDGTLSLALVGDNAGLNIGVLDADMAVAKIQSQSIFQVESGINLHSTNGDPNTANEPGLINDLCFAYTTEGDTGTLTLYVCTVTGGAGLATWVEYVAGAGMPTFTGDGSPVTTGQAATSAGQTYLDTTHGGLYISNDSGASTDDIWEQVGGDTNSADVPGLGFFGANILIMGDTGQTVNITDIDAFSETGSGNGFSWTSDGTDGDQTFRIQVGPNGTPITITVAADGTITLPGPVNMPNLPAADPHVAGQLYTTAGAVMQSAG
jgi:hypothetical protein